MPTYGGYGGPGDTFLKGYQIGLEGSLRTQQLRSEDAARRQQEAATAQHMALLLDQHNSQIDYEADLAKGGGVFAALTSPTVELPSAVPRDTVNDPGGESSDPSQGTTTTVPNPSRMAPQDAAIKAFLPAMVKHGDVKSAQALLANKAIADYRGQKLDVQEEGIDAQGDRNQANIDARFKAIDQRHKNELDTVQTKFENAQDLLDMKGIQAEKIQTMRNQARLAIAQGEVSREQFLNRHMNTYMTTIQNTKAGAKMDAASLKDAALKDLGAAWDMEIGARRQPTTDATVAPTALPSPLKSNPPSGKVPVISPDGKTGFIPASQLDEAIKAGYKRR